MNRYDRMVTQVDEATEALERLRSELDERSEAGIIELDPSDPDNPSIEALDEVAGAAVIALSDVFEVVKGLAEEGALELPTEPLPLADAALVTILANAEVAQRAMHADAEWLAGIMERAKR
jgi:hypothetical protein